MWIKKTLGIVFVALLLGGCQGMQVAQSYDPIDYSDPVELSASVDETGVIGEEFQSPQQGEDLSKTADAGQLIGESPAPVKPSSQESEEEDLEYDGGAYSKKLEKFLKEDPTRDYSKLLEDPSLLSVEITDSLYRNVYLHLLRGYVDTIDRRALFAGVKRELKDLFEQAKIDASGLDGVAEDESSMQYAVQAYGDQLEPSLIRYAALQGMLDSLHDPYTVLMLPEDFEKLQEQMQSKNFGGIGVYIELDRENDNQLLIFEPIEGTPAYKAGLMAGDKILKIDGETTENISLDDAQSKIRGPVGSTVVLHIGRDGEPSRDIPVVRGSIKVVSVTSKMLENKIGYIRCRTFGARTGLELIEEYRKLKTAGAESLIFDLRNNGGGYIDASVDVVQQFLSKPFQNVVYTLDRNQSREEYNTRGKGIIDIPVVCMINRFSASASEITAGALRDHKRAWILGENSFGKGSVQQLFTFRDGSALKMTIAKFYTPLGHVINKVGVSPDQELVMEPRFVGRGADDTQLSAAVAYLKGKQ